MARPTKQAQLNAAVENAENDIRAALPDLTRVLIDAASNASLEVICEHCRKKTKIERMGDPKIALALLERIAGKATEKKPETSTTAVERLLVELAGGASTTTPSAATPVKTPQQQAEEAIALAKVRAALKAAEVRP